MDFANKVPWHTKSRARAHQPLKVFISCADQGLDDERHAVREAGERLGLLMCGRDDDPSPWPSAGPSPSIWGIDHCDAMILLLRGRWAVRAGSRAEPGTTPAHRQLGASVAGLQEDPLEGRAFEELTKVAHDSELATVIALRAGFPRARLPCFTTPLGFWTNVVEEANNGVLHGGMRLIIEIAAEMYPSNAVFELYRKQAVSPRLESRHDPAMPCRENELARLEHERCKLRGIPVFAFLIRAGAPGEVGSPPTSSWTRELGGYEPTDGIGHLRSRVHVALSHWASSLGTSSGQRRPTDHHAKIMVGVSIVAISIMLTLLGTELALRHMNSDAFEPDDDGIHGTEFTRRHASDAEESGLHAGTSMASATLADLPFGYYPPRAESRRGGSDGGLRDSRSPRTRWPSSARPGAPPTSVAAHGPTAGEDPKPRREDSANPAGGHFGGRTPKSGKRSVSPGLPEEPSKETEEPEDEARADRHASPCSLLITDGADERSLVTVCPSPLVDDLHFETEISFSDRCQGIDAVGIFWDSNCDGFHFLGWSRDPDLCAYDVAWEGFLIKVIDRQHDSEVPVERLFCQDGTEHSWELIEGRDGKSDDPMIAVVLDSGPDSTYILVEGPREGDDRERTIPDVHRGGTFGFVLYSTDPSADLQGCLLEMSMATLVSPMDEDSSGRPGVDAYETPRFALIDDEPQEPGSESASGAWMMIPASETCEELETGSFGAMDSLSSES